MLQIEFLDGELHMELGQRARIRVWQPDATGTPRAVALQAVTFTYEPLEWGRVTPLDEPGVGELEVVRVVESDDPLLDPVYDLKASLTVKDPGGHGLRSGRQVRLLASALEVELGFEVGRAGNFRRFQVSELKSPIDWERVELSHPDCMSVVLREGSPHLRITHPDALPGWVAITLPNGERVQLHVEGAIQTRREGERRAGRAMSDERPPLPDEPKPARPEEPNGATAPPRPAAQAAQESTPGAPSAAETAAAESPTPGEAGNTLEELQSLRRYVRSFAGQLDQADALAAARIRERIEAEVARVWRHVETASADQRAQLETLFRQATDPLPEARQLAQELAG